MKPRLPIPLLAQLLTGVFASSSLLFASSPQVTFWGSTPWLDPETLTSATNVVAISAGVSHALGANWDGTVTAWGSDFHGQASVPAGLSNVVSVSAGAYFSLAVKADGTLAAWGKITDGWDMQPITIPESATNVALVSGGQLVAAALREDGNVILWNGAGLIPTPPDWTNIVSLAASGVRVVAVRSDSSVAILNVQTSEMSVPSGWTNVVATTAADVVLGLRSDGGVFSYGLPAPDPELLTNVAALSGYFDRGIALRRDGTVIPWGSPIYEMPAGLEGITAIASGPQYEMALRGEGAPLIVTQPISRTVLGGGVTHLTVVATGEAPLQYQWYLDGSQLDGQTNATLSLGTGPVPVLSGSYQVTVSNSHGSLTSRPARVTLSPAYVRVQPAGIVTYPNATEQLHATVVAHAPVTLRWHHNGIPLPTETNETLVLSAIRRDQAGLYTLEASNVYGSRISEPVSVAVTPVAAWGEDMDGKTLVPADLSDVVSVAAGANHGVALLRDGRVRDWGSEGATGQTATISNVISIAAGDFHSLALHHDGTVTAFGGDSHGQTIVPPGLSNVVAIDAGTYESIALRADGTVTLWGIEQFVPSWFTNVVAISGGLLGGVILRADGGLAAWGDPTFGFNAFPEGLSNVVAIDCGTFHCVALKADGTVATWGMSSTPVPEGLSNVVAVSAGGYNNLALLSTGELVGWGVFNGWNSMTSYVPATIRDVSAISAGMTHNLAVISDGPPFLTTHTIGRKVLGGRTTSFYANASGARPLYYQWQHAGTNLPGATNQILLLPDLQANHAGEYRVIVSNQLGSVTGPEAMLEVIPAYVSLQVTNMVSYTGGRAFLLGTASGNPGETFQWRFEGEVVPGATNSSLLITNLQPEHSGSYTLTISNRFGIIESPPCRLDVAPIAAWGLATSGTATNVPPNATNIVALSAGGGFSAALSREGTVLCWGTGAVTDVPTDATNVVALSASSSHLLALQSDGMVRAWGVQSYQPASVPAALGNVVAIAAGPSHNLAVRADGSVFGWGASNYGVTSPPPSLTNAVAVAAGRNHSIALRSDGTVVAWGLNSGGQTNVPLNLKDVIAIAAGNDHNLALRSDGTVAGWGRINSQLISIPAGLSNVVAIACGPNLCFAVRADGSQLGWGASVPPFGPTNAPADLRDVVSIACGTSHNVALIGTGAPSITKPVMNTAGRNGGKILLTVTAAGTPPFHYQWFRNGSPMEGANSSTLVLTNLHPNDAGIYTVEVGNALGVVLVTNATVTVNSLRFLQEPTDAIFASVGEQIEFTSIVEGLAPFSYQWAVNGLEIPGATNATLTLANVVPSDAGTYTVRVTSPYSEITSRGSPLIVRPVVVWGDNLFGQTEVPSSTTNAVAVAAGRNHTLALKADGTLVAWGDSNLGQCGVPSGLSNVVAVTAGAEHSLALVGDGSVIGWGRDSEGQCSPPPDLTNAIAIAAGAYHSLALTESGNVIAWGSNSSGQSSVPPNLAKAVAVACGENHSMALTSDGEVVAWGSNVYGQTNVPSGITNAVAIAAGLAHSVALLSDGTLVVWGNNTHGQLDTPADLANIVRLSAGALHNLAIAADGTIAAWEWNLHGQTDVPPNLSRCIDVAAGGSHSVALLAGNTVESRPELVAERTETGVVELNIASRAGRVYQVEHCESLNDSSKWIRLPLIPGTGRVVRVQEPALSFQRFYRIRVW